MPKPKHDRLKRSVAQVYLAFDRQIAQTMELKIEFEEYHPELAAALETVMEACVASQEMLRRFWFEAWGQEKPRWKSWI